MLGGLSKKYRQNGIVLTPLLHNFLTPFLFKPLLHPLAAEEADEEDGATERQLHGHSHPDAAQTVSGGEICGESEAHKPH